MFFFHKKDNIADKKYKWQPVVSDAQTILRLIEESVTIDAPICRLIIKCNDIIFKIGITSAYHNKKGFYNTVYFINDKEYEKYQEFKRSTDIENTPFEELLEPIYIIADEDLGNPRGYTLLAD